MKKRLAVVLPGFNEEQSIEKSLRNVKEGIKLFPQYEFTVYPIDDASTDNTYGALEHFAKKYDLDVRTIRNEQNKGVAQSLKCVYPKMVEEGYDAVVKTDLDADFNQTTVLERLVSKLENGKDCIVGIRAYDLKPGENDYELGRKQGIMPLLRELGMPENFDPSSCGSQLHKKESLERLMKSPQVQNYQAKWGLCVLLPLLAAANGSIEIVNLEQGQYDASRRKYDKVKLQYDTWTDTILNLLKKSHSK